MLAHGLALYPVIHYGTPEQKEHFLRPFADDAEGDLLAACAFTDVAGGATSTHPTRPAECRPSLSVTVTSG
jgi:alkylation response protein AidB-like acyl-CoA dehydrogenase